MSLESKIESLEAAVVKLTAAIKTLDGIEARIATSSQSAPASAPTNSPGQTDEAPAATSKANGKAKAKPAEKAEAKAEDPAKKLEEVVKPLVLKTVEKAGREAAVGVLKEFGAAKATELAPEKYDGVIAALNAAIAAAEVADDDLAA